MSDQSSVNLLNGLMMSIMGCTLGGFVEQSVDVMSKTDEELQDTIQQAVADEDHTLLNICVAEELNRQEASDEGSTES